MGPPGNVTTMLWGMAPDRHKHPPRYHNLTFGIVNGVVFWWVLVRVFVVVLKRKKVFFLK